MGFGQVGFDVLLLLAVGFSAAQMQGWSKVKTLQSPQALGSVAANVPQWALLGSQPQSAVQAALLQDALNVQSQQVLQGPVSELHWHYPQTPKATPGPALAFDLPQPAAANSLAVECGENTVYVEVKKDLFGTGELIDPLVLNLGGCSAIGEDPVAQVVMFETELQACNSTLRMTASELVYSFTLAYAPSALSSSAPVLRTSGAVIGLECHYPRFHNVSSKALLPAWIPYAATEVAEEELIFSLKLMLDDWKTERPSNQYYLGDLINIEASVMQFHHVPLRVYVDSCVATVVPDVNAVPKYYFIDNYGCLLDAKITGSKSKFLPQTQADVLNFQLETFKFQQDVTNLIYITCLLKATAASAPLDAQHKACSFSSNGWTAAYGVNQVCSCCDTSCGLRKGRDLTNEGLFPEEELVLGPISVQELA